jgi:UDP-N-acetylenolpyruvoylglucosamine reductase
MQHANFITTTKEATGNDVITLIRNIKDRIEEHSGIKLQEELVIWSRDPEIQR